MVLKWLRLNWPIEKGWTAMAGRCCHLNPIDEPIGIPCTYSGPKRKMDNFPKFGTHHHTWVIQNWLLIWFKKALEIHIFALKTKSKLFRSCLMWMCMCMYGYCSLANSDGIWQSKAKGIRIHRDSYKVNGSKSPLVSLMMPSSSHLSVNTK
jgi:hypothetical protein